MKKCIYVWIISMLTAGRLHAIVWIDSPSVPVNVTHDYRAMTKQQLLTLRDELNAQLLKLKNKLSDYMNEIYLRHNPNFNQQQIADTQSQMNALHNQTEDINSHLDSGAYRK